MNTISGVSSVESFKFKLDKESQNKTVLIQNKTVLIQQLKKWLREDNDSTNKVIKGSIGFIKKLKFEETRFDNKNWSKAYLAKANDSSLLGLVLVTKNQENGLHIDYLVAHPDYQKIGAGSALLQKVAKKALKHDRKELTLNSIPSAVEFYKKRGFTQDSTNLMTANEQTIKTLSKYTYKK